VISENIDVKMEFFGISPLHVAAHIGNVMLVEKLLNAGASVEADPIPLCVAAAMGHSEVIKVLRLKIPNIPLDATTSRSPIGFSCERNHVDATRFLLDCGASPINCGKNGETLLHLIASPWITKEMRQLVLEKTNLNPHAMTTGGITPLSRAASFGNIEAVQALMGLPSASANDSNPLEFAVTYGRLDLVGVLAPTAGPDLLNTCLHALALGSGRKDIATVLVCR
jgi:ankyrin repeat protein